LKLSHEEPGAWFLTVGTNTSCFALASSMEEVRTKPWPRSFPLISTYLSVSKCAFPLIVADPSQAEFTGTLNTKETDYSEVSPPEQHCTCRGVKPSCNCKVLQHLMSAVLTTGSRIAGSLSYMYRHRRAALVNAGSNYYIFTSKHSCQKCNVDHWAVTIYSPLNFDCRKQEINPNEKLIIHF